MTEALLTAEPAVDMYAAARARQVRRTKPQVRKDDFDFHVGLFVAKTEERDGQWYIYAVASGPQIDRQGERMGKDALAGMKVQFDAGFIPLVPNHKDDNWDRWFGIVIGGKPNKDGNLLVEVWLDRDHELAQNLWRKLHRETPDGRLHPSKLGVSIGGYTIKSDTDMVDGRVVHTINDIELVHLAVTPSPAYPPAWIQSYCEKAGESELPPYFRDWKHDIAKSGRRQVRAMRHRLERETQNGGPGLGLDPNRADDEKEGSMKQTTKTKRKPEDELEDILTAKAVTAGSGPGGGTSGSEHETAGAVPKTPGDEEIAAKEDGDADEDGDGGAAPTPAGVPPLPADHPVADGSWKSAGEVMPHHQIWTKNDEDTDEDADQDGVNCADEDEDEDGDGDAMKGDPPVNSGGDDDDGDDDEGDVPPTKSRKAAKSVKRLELPWDREERRSKEQARTKVDKTQAEIQKLQDLVQKAVSYVKKSEKRYAQALSEKDALLERKNRRILELKSQQKPSRNEGVRKGLRTTAYDTESLEARVNQILTSKSDPEFYKMDPASKQRELTSQLSAELQDLVSRGAPLQ